MNKECIFAPYFHRHLPDRFYKRGRLKISNGPAYLRNDHFCITITSELIDTFLNFIGDMRDKLHGSAQIIPSPFFGNDRAVYRTCCEIRVLIEINPCKSFIIAEIEVGFRPVPCHEHLTVLEWVHRTSIRVEIWVDFDHHNLEPTIDEQATQRCRRYSFSDARDYTASYEDVLCHQKLLLSVKPIPAGFYSGSCDFRISSTRSKSAGTSTPINGYSVSTTRMRMPRSRKRNCSSPSALSYGVLSH